MLNSMNTAVTAIKANQTKLDVTANNIANVNTIGYKKDRVLFSSMLSQTMRTAAAPQNGLGGINPSGVGMGVQIGSINKIYTQGIFARTGRNLDAAISGNGFFTVTDGLNKYYTRNGSFDISTQDGSLVTSTGMKVMGYGVDENGKPNTTNGLSPIKVPSMQDMISQATSKVEFTGNLNSEKIGEEISVPYTIYDSLGTKHELDMKITIDKKGEANWQVTSKDGLTLSGAKGKITLDDNGQFVSSTGGPIEFTPIGAEKVTLDMDFSKATMLDKDSDFSMKHQNGMPAGKAQGIVIGEGGVIQCSYSNGMTKAIGYLGIAEFENPEGLIAKENSMYEVSANTGQPNMVAGSSTSSNVVSGFLESSNVDISEELTDMIKTQRAYQMATKVVTTSDEILQDLVAMKR